MKLLSNEEMSQQKPGRWVLIVYDGPLYPGKAKSHRESNPNQRGSETIVQRYAEEFRNAASPLDPLLGYVYKSSSPLWHFNYNDCFQSSGLKNLFSESFPGICLF